MGAVARSVLPPGWQSHMTQHGTGLQVIGFDPTSGMGWSLQPLYENETEPPLKLIVGCYLPPFQLRCMTDVLKLGARSVAQDLLGPSYEVKVSSTHVDKFYLLEFLISRARAAEIATADQASTPDSGAPVPRMQRTGRHTLRGALNVNRAIVLKRDSAALKPVATRSAAGRKSTA
jgi:hypothetical protein